MFIYSVFFVSQCKYYFNLSFFLSLSHTHTHTHTHTLPLSLFDIHIHTDVHPILEPGAGKWGGEGEEYPWFPLPNYNDTTALRLSNGYFQIQYDEAYNLMSEALKAQKRYNTLFSLSIFLFLSLSFYLLPTNTYTHTQNTHNTHTHTHTCKYILTLSL